MSEKLGTVEERDLWRRAQAASAGTAPSVSPEELAGWLDGRLGEPEAARVEAALAANPVLLDTALDVRAVSRGVTAPAPDRLLVRSRALVAPAVADAPAGSRIGHWLGTWRLGVQMGAVAMTAIAISIGGFTLGGATQTALANQRQWGALLTSVIDSLGDTGLPGIMDPGGDQ